MMQKGKCQLFDTSLSHLIDLVASFIHHSDKLPTVYTDLCFCRLLSDLHVFAFAGFYSFMIVLFVFNLAMETLQGMNLPFPGLLYIQNAFRCRSCSSNRGHIRDLTFNSRLS